MIELTCVACRATKCVPNSPDELRNPHCSRCGQPIILMRQPGSAPGPYANT